MRDLLCVMILEFVLMHASAFMTAFQALGKTRAKRTAIVLGFAAFYSLFAIGMPLAWDAPWLIVGFATLVGGKVMATRNVQTEKQVVVGLMLIGVNILTYGTFILLAAFCPFPRLGITATRVRPPGGDAFHDPHTIIAAGFLYFLAHAVLLYQLRKRMRRADGTIELVAPQSEQARKRPPERTHTTA